MREGTVPMEEVVTSSSEEALRRDSLDQLWLEPLPKGRIGLGQISGCQPITSCLTVRKWYHKTPVGLPVNCKPTFMRFISGSGHYMFITELFTQRSIVSQHPVPKAPPCERMGTSLADSPTLGG